MCLHVGFSSLCALWTPDFGCREKFNFVMRTTENTLALCLSKRDDLVLFLFKKKKMFLKILSVKRRGFVSGA